MFTLSLALVAASTSAVPDAYVCLGTTSRAIGEVQQRGSVVDPRLTSAQAFWLERVRVAVRDTPDASLIEDARVSRLDQAARAYRRELRRCLANAEAVRR